MKFDTEKVSSIHRRKMTFHQFSSVAFSLFVKGPSIALLVIFVVLSLRAGGIGHIMVDDTSAIDSTGEKPQTLREEKNVCVKSGEITAEEAEGIFNKTLMNFYVLTVLISGVFIFLLMRRK